MQRQVHVTFLEMTIGAAFIVVPLILSRTASDDSPALFMIGFILFACVVGYIWTKKKL